MTAAGFILIGLAAGMLIGALAAYGFMFIWAIKCGRGGRRAMSAGKGDTPRAVNGEALSPQLGRNFYD
jgi:hypothetical protein